jgi:hypothetical protein
MQVLVEDSEIAETGIPYPEAGCRPHGGDGVCEDQEPQQVMMDKLGQGEKADVAASHGYCDNPFRMGPLLEKSTGPTGHTDRESD